jgi:hypothetical protein
MTVPLPDITSAVTVAVVGTASPLAVVVWTMGWAPSGTIVCAAADGATTRTSFVAGAGGGGGAVSLAHDVESSAGSTIEADAKRFLGSEPISPGRVSVASLEEAIAFSRVRDTLAP